MTVIQHNKIIKAYNKCPYVFGTGCTKCYIYKFKRKQMFEQDCNQLFNEASNIIKLLTKLNTWISL